MPAVNRRRRLCFCRPPDLQTGFARLRPRPLHSAARSQFASLHSGPPRPTPGVRLGPSAQPLSNSPSLSGGFFGWLTGRRRRTASLRSALYGNWKPMRVSWPAIMISAAAPNLGPEPLTVSSPGRKAKWPRSWSCARPTRTATPRESTISACDALEVRAARISRCLQIGDAVVREAPGSRS